ncbi:unnamed protein product [Cuscuta epithymum]|uniref:Uncharacterized protein n=1 Tax=Cuscuta epithymum TaxID=186058 RepID=A0AAV0D5S6_9ASTE|nr:unnamed protein product [Cuscuta epithymum]
MPLTDGGTAGYRGAREAMAAGLGGGPAGLRKCPSLELQAAIDGGNSFRSCQQRGGGSSCGVRLRRWPPETAGMLQRASPDAADSPEVHRGGDGHGGSGDLKNRSE